MTIQDIVSTFQSIENQTLRAKMGVKLGTLDRLQKDARFAKLLKEADKAVDDVYTHLVENYGVE